MKKYKLKTGSTIVKTYVAVITYGTCLTQVTIDNGDGTEEDIAKSVGSKDDGIHMFNYNGDIPITAVKKNNELSR